MGFFSKNELLPLSPGEIEIKYKAEQGDMAAQFELGVVYMNNNNFREGKSWIEKSASQGYGHAMDCVSMCFSVGICGFKKDQYKAVFWMKKVEKLEEEKGFELDTSKQPKQVQENIKRLGELLNR